MHDVMPTEIRLPKRRETLHELYGERFPESWYLVMPSRKLGRGKLLPLDAFGSKWVVARTESGLVEVLSRFCPHMGAPLHTGCVQGERVVCPFHRWEFERGECKAIPYQKEGKIPPTARLQSLPVREHLGFIWVYNGPQPSHELPDLPEASDHRFGRSVKSVWYDTHMLAVLENGSDAQHFKYIHGVNFEHYELEMTHDQPHAFGFHIHKRVRTRFGRCLNLTTSIRYVGASTIFGANIVEGRTVGRFIAAPLPVSAKRIRYNLIAFPRRLPIPGIDSLLQAFAGRLLFSGAQDDYIPIWSQMDPTKGGVMIKEDAHQIRFRRYYRSHLPPDAGEKPD